MGKHLGEKRRRQDILSAAKSLFVRKGFADTSLDDIASAAGISRGGMYFYYRNKLEMLAALSQEEVDQSLSYLVRSLEGPMGHPEALLNSIMAYYIRYLVTQPDSTKLYQLLLDTAQRHDEVRQILAENLVRVETTLTQMLDHSGVLEGMQANFSPRQMAMLINTIVEGVKSRYLVTGDAQAVKETVEAVASLAFPLSPVLSERIPNGNGTQKTQSSPTRRAK